MKQSLLTQEEALKHLQGLDLVIGKWNEIEPISYKNWNDVSVKVPKDSWELMHFSFRLIGWLGKSDWKLVVFTNSTSLLSAELDFVIGETVLNLKEDEFNELSCQCFLLEKESEYDEEKINLRIGLLLFYAIVFCEHVRVVASDTPSRILMVEDGMCTGFTNDVKAEKEFLSLENQSSNLNNWLIERIGRYQDKWVR